MKNPHTSTPSCREGCSPPPQCLLPPPQPSPRVCVCFCYERNWDIIPTVTFICDVVGERLVSSARSELAL